MLWHENAPNAERTYATGRINTLTADARYSVIVNVCALNVEQNIALKILCITNRSLGTQLLYDIFT